MNKSILLLAFMSAFAHSQTSQNNNDTNSQFNRSTSTSSGSLQNYQVNNGSDIAYNKIGDVSCAAPQLTSGLADREGGEGAMFYVGVQVPLGGSTCKSAHKQRLSRMEYDMHVAIVEQNKRDIIFQEKMAKVCVELHHIVTVDEMNLLAIECSSFEPTHGHPAKVGSFKSRISGHGPG